MLPKNLQFKLKKNKVHCCNKLWAEWTLNCHKSAMIKATFKPRRHYSLDTNTNSRYQPLKIATKLELPSQATQPHKVAAELLLNKWLHNKCSIDWLIREMAHSRGFKDGLSSYTVCFRPTINLLITQLWIMASKMPRWFQTRTTIPSWVIAGTSSLRSQCLTLFSWPLDLWTRIWRISLRPSSLNLTWTWSKKRNCCQRSQWCSWWFPLLIACNLSRWRMIQKSLKWWSLILPNATRIRVVTCNQPSRRLQIRQIFHALK